MFRSLLCLLVLATQSHCILAHVFSPGPEANTPSLSNPQTHLPLQPDEPTCVNESGCICKGAIVAAPFAIPVDHGSVRWIDQAAIPNETDSITPARPVAPGEIQALPTGDSARVRAYLQSFQL